jgi:hypothetical protein
VILPLVHRKSEGPTVARGAFIFSGSDLLSQTVTRQVPSAQRGLTSVFGMGTGVSLSVRPPEKLTKFHNPIGLQSIHARRKGMYGQAARPISTGQLHALPRFHLPPIKLVIYQRPLGAYARDT